MSLLPDDTELDLIHTRDYQTRVYQISEDELLVRGVVSDRKPPGLYVIDDPEPVEIHQMQLELRVALPKLEIRSARVVFATYPHAGCPRIADGYEKLVGLSIARGFTRKIRDLFGGPNGCAHTNALLQAMAPAIVQATWSIGVRETRRAGRTRERVTPEEAERIVKGNQNTCHLWAEGGDHLESLRRGNKRPPLLPVQERLRELGRDESRWE
ncbi:MAG: hypothetical protein CL908_05170 [Deltaproteobacteria bacterium]|nr:hypothetical protein [Deltaproteobacteria bacterium]